MSVLARSQITIVVINDGPTGPTGKRMLTGMVHYQLSNASAPAKPSATAFNFSTRVFSGLTANWAIDSPVYASGNANKYWYCTYTVEESTSGSGTGTPVFGTVKQAIGFSGLVTFTGDQSVSDGAKTLSFGATGTTKIDGGNIETGTVSADRIDVDNLVVKQAVIGKIQDVAGPLASTAKSEAISAAASDASTKATAAENAAKAYADTQLGNFATTVTGDISDLQNQIDGSITTHFYAYVPTTANAPASGWTTTALKNQHLGDLFYNTATGFCYRYQLVGGVYSWQRITDSDVTKALADAAEAKDTADSKRRVFVATPVTPYDIGDLWLKSGDLYKCKVTRATGSYVASDWEKGVKYTDDTVANANLVTAKAYADTKKAEAIAAAEAAAEAEALAAQTAAEAHADGIVTAEEQARIADVNAKLVAAQSYAETKATEAKNAAEATAAALDDAIQVGGRNYWAVAKNAEHSYYLKYEGDYVFSNNTSASAFAMFRMDTLNVPLNNQYTITFEIKVTNENIQFHDDVYYVNSALTVRHNKPQLIVDEWVKVEASFYYAIENTTATHIYINGATGINQYQIRNFNLKQGNKATDWTPAPEDVDADIAAAVTTAASDANTKMNAAKDALAVRLGYTNYAAMAAEAAATGKLIVGGLLNANIIDVQTLVGLEAFLTRLVARNISTTPNAEGWFVRIDDDDPTVFEVRKKVDGVVSETEYMKVGHFAGRPTLEFLSSGQKILIDNFGVTISVNGIVKTMIDNGGLFVNDSDSSLYTWAIAMYFDTTLGMTRAELRLLPTSYNSERPDAIWKDSKGYLKIGNTGAYTAADVGALPSNTIQYFTQAQWNALTQAQKDAVPLALVQE